MKKAYFRVLPVVLFFCLGTAQAATVSQPDRFVADFHDTLYSSPLGDTNSADSNLITKNNDTDYEYDVEYDHIQLFGYDLNNSAAIDFECITPKNVDNMHEFAINNVDMKNLTENFMLKLSINF